jgi:hypothetical protein
MSKGDESVSRDFLDGYLDQMNGEVASSPGMLESAINALTFGVLDTSRSSDYYEGAIAAEEKQKNG